MGMKASSGFFHGTNGDLRFKLDIQFFASSKNELFSSTGHVSERSISKNREYFYGKSASEIASSLNEQGYKRRLDHQNMLHQKPKLLLSGILISTGILHKYWYPLVLQGMEMFHM